VTGARLAALLALFYPLAVHAGVTRGVPLVALGLLAVLIMLAAWKGLNPIKRFGLAATLGAALWLASLLQAANLLLYVLPVLIQSSLALVFLRSLRPGGTPLITRYALSMGAQDTPQVHRYTRSVTRTWALMCAILAVTSTLLALLAPVQLWSLFANGLSYLLLAALFVLEYPVRRLVLGNQTRPGFFRYLLDLTRLDHRQVLRCP
jgi:uncharacterized membrane protein